MLAVKHENYASSNMMQETVLKDIELAARGTTTNKWDKATTFTCIVLCGAVAWMVGINSAGIDKANYQVDNMQQQLKHVSADDASLRAQVDKLEQPAIILNIALHKLGMQPANPINIFPYSK